ncbi:hypothetical protein [Kroppenstedtia eburnea]|uniref:hypothetical protein n=1 Tax=Kroppenstedtia eburnea TaxID=714067 RepID=UPI0036D2FDE9
MMPFGEGGCRLTERRYCPYNKMEKIFPKKVDLTPGGIDVRFGWQNIRILGAAGSGGGVVPCRVAGGASAPARAGM